jgi:hypothetical protein
MISDRFWQLTQQAICWHRCHGRSLYLISASRTLQGEIEWLPVLSENQGFIWLPSGAGGVMWPQGMTVFEISRSIVRGPMKFRFQADQQTFWIRRVEIFEIK